jgi:hypothetical protein
MRSFTSLDYVIAGALGSIIWLYKLGKNLRDHQRAKERAMGLAGTSCLPFRTLDKGRARGRSAAGRRRSDSRLGRMQKALTWPYSSPLLPRNTGRDTTQSRAKFRDDADIALLELRRGATSMRHIGPSARPCRGVSIREVQGVRMRPINIKPASVAGGIFTATSAFRISFSRTTLPDPSDVLLGAG